MPNTADSEEIRGVKHLALYSTFQLQVDWHTVFLIYIFFVILCD